MPRELFTAELKKKGRRFWTLSDLCRMTDDVFAASVTSTVRRYCQFDVEPCAMVISEAGEISSGQATRAMSARSGSSSSNGGSGADTSAGQPRSGIASNTGGDSLVPSKGRPARRSGTRNLTETGSGEAVRSATLTSCSLLEPAG